MRNLTFERAVLIVLVLIILVSTSGATIEYIGTGIESISKTFSDEEGPPPSNGPAQTIGFPTVLKPADDLYNLGDYEGAASAYLALTINNTLSKEQKAHSFFRLGLSQYNIGNYKLASEYFTKVGSFDPRNSVAFNNAAVAAYKAEDLPRAIELQIKALTIWPAVEYYYNLARMYEDSEEYDLAVTNYNVVAIAEDNLSLADRIDPVRVKEKLTRLESSQQVNVDPSAYSGIRALQLIAARDVLTVNENEMQLKPGDFELAIQNLKSSKNLIAKYDRTKLDPYKLITEVLWTVFKDGSEVFSKKGDKISYNAKSGGDYEIKLSVKYNGNKNMLLSKTVHIEENKSPVIIEKPSEEDVLIVEIPTSTRIDKTYEYAAYEQLFEEDFNLDTKSYSDQYGVIWGKDDVQTQIVRKSVIDKRHSLEVTNTGISDGGIWANFDTFLGKQNLKNSSVRISFFARSVSTNADLNLMVRIKSGESILNVPQKINLESKMEENSLYLSLPSDTQGLTITISTKPTQSFRIDGFRIMIDPE